MPLNLTKEYNELLDIIGMSEAQRTKSLRRIFNRDIQDNNRFYFNGKPIYPTPEENGQVAMENLFNHLTRKVIDEETKHREFDISRSQRLHWIRHHIDQLLPDNRLCFSVAEPRCTRTYIYDVDEKYVIVLEPLRNGVAYYLLTAYPLEGKDAARDKIMNKYKRRRLPNLL